MNSDSTLTPYALLQDVLPNRINMKQVINLTTLFVFLCIFSSCKENIRSQQNSIQLSAEDSTTNKNDVAVGDSDRIIINTLSSYLAWSENHNDYNISILDSLCVDENEFWFFKKDNTLLMDKLNKLYVAKKNAYLAQEDRKTNLDIGVYSYKKANYISLYETVITYSFNRDLYECFQTFINYNDKIYLVKIKSTEHIRKIVNEYIKKYKIKIDKESFDISQSFDFYISNGELRLAPLYEKDMIEDSDAGEDDIPGFIKIQLDDNLKFQLTNIDDIIKKYE